MTYQRFKLKFYFILFTLFISVSCSQSLEKNLLWKIYGEQNIIYIVGDIEVLSKYEHPLPSKFETAYRNSTTFVLEVDYDSLNSESAQNLQYKNSLNRDGISFKNSVPESIYNLAFDKANELGTDIHGWLIRPMYLSSYLYYCQLLENGIMFEEQLDNYFLENAKRDKKTIKSLGSVEFYHQDYADISLDKEIAILHNTLLRLDTIDTEISSIITFWKDGNVNELEKFYRSRNQVYPNSVKNIFKEKVEHFSTQIEKILKLEENHFIVLPMEYIIMNDGILIKLKQKGYRIEQL